MTRSRLTYGAFAVILSFMLFWPIRRAESLFFDFNHRSDWMGRGWSQPERDKSGTTFTWAFTTQAELKVVAFGRRDRAILFRCWAYEGLGRQGLTVFVNGARVGTMAIGARARTYDLVASRARWRDGENGIRLQFARAARPFDAGRALAAAFDWIQIVPLGP